MIQTNVTKAEGDNFQTVDKNNFLNYFTLGGTSPNPATYDSTTGDVTLTEDVGNRVGTMTLNDQIFLDKDFDLDGEVNLGHSNGADGIGFAFYDGNGVSTLGNGLGIYGLCKALGFRLDTYNNDPYGYPNGGYPQYPMSDPIKGDPLPIFPIQPNPIQLPLNTPLLPWGNEYGGFIMNAPDGRTYCYKWENGYYSQTFSPLPYSGRDGHMYYPCQVIGYQALPDDNYDKRNDTNGNPVNFLDNQFHPYHVHFDGSTKVLTIDVGNLNYNSDGTVNPNNIDAGHLRWQINVPQYYKQYGYTNDSIPSAYSLVVTGSTGESHNKQQFKFKSFKFYSFDSQKFPMEHRDQYTTGGTTINASYLDGFFTSENLSPTDVQKTEIKDGEPSNDYINNSDIQSFSFDPSQHSFHFTLNNNGSKKIIDRDNVKMTIVFQDKDGIYHPRVFTLYEPLDYWMPSKELQNTVIASFNNSINNGGALSTSLFNVGNTGTNVVSYSNTVPSSITTVSTDNLVKSMMPNLQILMNNIHSFGSDSNAKFDYIANGYFVNNNSGEYNAYLNPTGLEYATNLQALVIPGSHIVETPNNIKYNGLLQVLETIKSNLKYLDIGGYDSGDYSFNLGNISFQNSLQALNIRNAGLTQDSLYNGSPTLLNKFIYRFKNNLQSLDMSSVKTVGTDPSTLNIAPNYNSLPIYFNNDSLKTTPTGIQAQYQDLRNNPHNVTLNKESSEYVSRLPITDFIKQTLYENNNQLELESINPSNYSVGVALCLKRNSDGHLEQSSDPNLIKYDTSKDQIVIDWTKIVNEYVNNTTNVDLLLSLTPTTNPTTGTNARVYTSISRIKFPVLTLNYIGIDNSDVQYQTNNGTFNFNSTSVQSRAIPLVDKDGSGNFKYDITSLVPSSGTATYGSVSTPTAFYYDSTTTVSDSTNISNGLTHLSGSITPDKLYSEPSFNLYYRLNELDGFSLTDLPDLHFGRRKVKKNGDGIYPNGTTTSPVPNNRNNLGVQNLHTSGTKLEYRVLASATQFHTTDNSSTLSTDVYLDYDGVSVKASGTDQPILIWNIPQNSNYTNNPIIHTFANINLVIPNSAWSSVETHKQYSNTVTYILSVGPS